MSVNNFAPAEYGGYVLGANSGGGGGGGIEPLETYTIHITAPAIEGFYFNVYNVTDTVDNNTYLCYAVVDDDDILPGDLTLAPEALILLLAQENAMFIREHIYSEIAHVVPCIDILFSRITESGHYPHKNPSGRSDL